MNRHDILALVGRVRRTREFRQKRNKDFSHKQPSNPAIAAANEALHEARVAALIARHAARVTGLASSVPRKCKSVRCSELAVKCQRCLEHYELFLTRRRGKVAKGETA